MAKDTPIADLVAALEGALNVVKAAKEKMDSTAATAASAKKNYDAAVSSAQTAHAAYAAHVNEVMAGFAQIHQ